MTTSTHTWHRVTRADPCIACGGVDWCGFTDGHELIRCMRSGETPEGYRLIRQNPDGGTLYGLIGDAAQRPAPPPRPAKPRPTIDWGKRHAEARARVHPGELHDFADDLLGLEGPSMDLLEVGVEDAPGSGWLFPERDAEGNVIGMVRRTPDGRKLCLPGSRRGLTYQVPFPTDDPVLVCEGQSDTAALIEAGIVAVGRPSNTGGGDHLSKLLKGRDVIVLGENDQKADSTWPGRDGAEHIAKQLRKGCKSVRILFPPDQSKDARTWLCEGITQCL